MARKEFNLIELAAVIAVMATLAAIALPIYEGVRNDTRKAEQPLVRDGIQREATAFKLLTDLTPTTTTWWPPTVTLGRQARAWDGATPPLGYTQMGFEAPGEVWASYRWVVHPTFVCVDSVADLDGNGVKYLYLENFMPDAMTSISVTEQCIGGPVPCH